MSATKFSPFLVVLTIILMVVGCASPTSAPPAIKQTTLPSAVPTSTQTVEAQLASEIDNYLTTLAKQDQLSGSILVAVDGKVLLSKGYGMANLELDVPNTPQTKFQLGSLTKQFTAMAILQLQQQGKLNVHDPICQYIRYTMVCPEAWQSITIHHLLTHTSGIKDYTAFSNFSEFGKQSMKPLELSKLFRDLPLNFTPGERWDYSNSGYVLLGHIIEWVSDESYGIFLLKNIFQPLQMADTGYGNNSTILKDRADGYFSSAARADYFDPSVAYAAGGLYSTVKDLFLWDQALSTDKLIPRTLRDQMFTSFSPIPSDSDIFTYMPADVTDVGYGYGWVIGKQSNHLWVWHSGHYSGFSNMISRYPDDKVTIILLTNREATGLGDIASEIARMIFREK